MVIFYYRNFGMRLTFIYEFFDTVNSSVCYQNVDTKPKFAPYHGPRPTLTVIHF